jgi:hypothetical protein
LLELVKSLAAGLPHIITTVEEAASGLIGLRPDLQVDSLVFNVFSRETVFVLFEAFVDNLLDFRVFDELLFLLG